MSDSHQPELAKVELDRALELWAGFLIFVAAMGMSQLLSLMGQAVALCSLLDGRGLIRWTGGEFPARIRK